MRKIGELAGRRACRALQRPGRAKRQEIGQIEEMAGLGDRFGLAPCEPGKLWRMHLGRNPAAHVPQRLVPAGVDPLRVLDRAMVHPHDHVALGRARRAHRQWTPVAVERDQRASGVEAHALDRLRRQARRLDRFTHRRGHRAPDVVRRLLDDLARLAPDCDWTTRARDEPSRAVENTGPGAKGADVNPDIGLAHGIPGVSSGREDSPFRAPLASAKAEAARRSGLRERRIAGVNRAALIALTVGPKGAAPSSPGRRAKRGGRGDPRGAAGSWTSPPAPRRLDGRASQ